MGSSKAAWLTGFFILQICGFTCLLLALVTPSWQYVYLEDGRTEHQHGLWLDCKRDYSNEYGRPRDYYETLYRRDHLQGPFDQFWLPALQCVYKFDYWLDEEDWFEHGYDENRLQGDAYQHLFIGWKIAALTAISFATVLSLAGVIVLFWAFCHRTLVCVTAVLVVLSLFGCSIGNTVFYFFANYQDNNIIKEEDGIYQQWFGWSFYSSVMANIFLFLASFVGCFSTKATLGKKKAQLVKIELPEEDDERLIRQLDSVENKFKRSKSAIYKIDSKELRKWEKEQMKIMQKTAFKRANSMPNIKKMVSKPSLNLMSSTSDISKAVTEPATAPRVNFFDLPHKEDDDDLIYEYVEANTVSLNSDRTYNSGPPLPKRPTTSTKLPVYDSVFDNAEEEEYLKPRSVASTPVGITPRPAPLREVLSRHDIEKHFEQRTLHAVTSMPFQNIKKADSTVIEGKPVIAPKPALRSSLRHSKVPPTSQPSVQINTFAYRDEEGRIRSLTNLNLSVEPSESSRTSRALSEIGQQRSQPNNGLKETNFGVGYAPSENDRSVGSMTYRLGDSQFDAEDDRSTVSTSISGGSTTFKASRKEFTMV
ncbi:unnamed protein product [Bursaphelenchus xylophilus]|uniref:(pine wood nematode) hypothetical protein n=1 Tax=Bursaphelenchus xylophilus TaxID=6326 RepID=A0A7I8WTG2_BURXY|nr:unnamed protein product [Bursaphelenchus xylophilus]CAG9116083.1 unnamed protein product [Bursaphelenchus xylophilus]